MLLKRKFTIILFGLLSAVSHAQKCCIVEYNQTACTGSEIGYTEFEQGVCVLSCAALQCDYLTTDDGQTFLVHKRSYDGCTDPNPSRISKATFDCQNIVGNNGGVSLDVVGGPCPSEECPEECGCGYTQGFWKTHCDQSTPSGSLCSAKDEPWPQIGNLATPTESLDVCTIIQYYAPGFGICACPVQDPVSALVNGFDSSEDSNAAVNLYRQFIAAALNTEKLEDSACTYPIDQVGGLARAAELLRLSCFADGLDAAQEQEADALKTILDDFNNGRLADTCGPEHCDGLVPPEECPPEPCELCDEEGEIVPHGGRLLDHRDGSAATPYYCLRLDQGSDVYTYSCVAGDAEAYWQVYEDGVLRVWGSVYGGRDTGSDWDSPQLYSIDATYSGFTCCASPEADQSNGPNDLCAPSGAAGVLYITDAAGNTVKWYSKSRDGFQAVIGDYHREAGEVFSLFGWLARTGIDGTHDWLSELTCQRQDCPPAIGPVAPGDDCGCGYTIGYWGSPRFVGEDDECTPFAGRIPSASSNHDTCRWPVIDGEDSRGTVICPKPQCPSEDPNCAYTWWDILQNNYNSFVTGKGRDRSAPFQREWYNAARQAIAFRLNVAQGYCGAPCSTPSSPDTEDECSALLELLPVVEELLSSCPSDSEVFEPLCPAGNPACDYLCGLVQHEEVLGDGECKLAEIFDLANNGLLGPDHCEEDDQSAGLRGCCAGRPGYPACVPDSEFHFNKSSPATDCCTNAQRLDCGSAAFTCVNDGTTQEVCEEQRQQCLRNCGTIVAAALPACAMPPSPPMPQENCEAYIEELEGRRALDIAILIFVILGFLIVIVLLVWLCARAASGKTPVDGELNTWGGFLRAHWD